MVVVEKHIDGLGVVGKNAGLDFLQLLVLVIMGVPGGPAMDSFVEVGVYGSSPIG